MVPPGDLTFAYGWVVKRNPRTFAGVDVWGRTVLVTVDGRTSPEGDLDIKKAHPPTTRLWLCWPPS